MTGNGRRAALEVLHPDEAATLAAQAAVTVRDLLTRAQQDPHAAVVLFSDASRYAQIGLFYVGYVAMFERNT